MVFMKFLNLFVGVLMYCETIDCVIAKTNDLASFDLFDTLTTENVFNSQSNPTRRNQDYFHTVAILNITYFDPIVGEFKTESENKARFGEGQVLNVTGKLVHVTNRDDKQNHDGCTTNICGTRCEELPTVPWIALIKRGECKFEKKINNVYRQKNPAIGVIVYSDEDKLVKMQVEGKNRNITAIIVMKKYGEHLVDLVHTYDNVEVNIKPGPKERDDKRNLTPTSVLFVTISFIILMLISVLWLVIYYFQRFRYLQTKDKQSKQLYNVAKRIISKIPTKKMKAEDVDNEKDCCGICIESYVENDSIRVLPCKHEFHTMCVDPWLLEHRTCPMCKMDILKHYGFSIGTRCSPSNSTVIDDIMRGQIPNDRNNSDNNSNSNVITISAPPTEEISSSNSSNPISNNVNNNSNNNNTNNTSIVSVENRQIIDV